MAMHADYTDINFFFNSIKLIEKTELMIDKVMYLGTQSSYDKSLHPFIISKTSRQSVFTFIHDNKFELIEKCTVNALCKRIGLADSRVGAIIVGMETVSPLFFKKLREIASAEDAMLILYLSNFSKSADVIRYSSPDAIIFEYRHYWWLGLPVRT